MSGLLSRRIGVLPNRSGERINRVRTVSEVRELS